MNKIISVITPTHNRSQTFLAQAIESVMLQNENGFSHEHIIVDNQSTDQTKRLVGKFIRKDKRIKYVYNNRNLGAADGLNLGFSKSKGELIVPLDDDDLLPRNSLQFRWDFFAKDKSIMWAYGHIAFIDIENRLWKDLLEYNTKYVFRKNYFYSLLIKNFIPGGSTTFRRKAIKQVGGWNPEIQTQDFEMSLKLADAGFVPHKMDSYLYYYRLHPDQAHKRQMKAGIYKQEWEYYLKHFRVDKKLLNKLSKDK